jgi:hypothetical protein
MILDYWSGVSDPGLLEWSQCNHESPLHEGGRKVQSRDEAIAAKTEVVSFRDRRRGPGMQAALSWKRQEVGSPLEPPEAHSGRVCEVLTFIPSTAMKQTNNYGHHRLISDFWISEL